jgi:predicted RNA-binding protein with TRAM domain
MKRTSFLVAGIILAGVCTAWLFTPSVSERIAAALKKFNEEFPQEKVYVHTDRPYYLAGETIWFKAYLTAGSFHQLSPLSKTLYVELVNEKKEKIMQLMVRLNEGTGHADILLPSDLKSGNYLLRAYTNWMRNYDEDFFYNQEIKIWNIDEKISQPPVVALEPVDLQFFPEGGHLVSGIKSNIAFKAVGSDGLGKKVKGKIYSASGTVEAEFESTHLGMGMFSFTPEQGQHYTAEIEDMNQMEAQKALKYDLPTVEDRGFVITVTNKEDQEEVVVKIQSTESTPRPQTLTLAAHHRGELSFVAQINFANVIYFVKMPKANLLHGLTHITLFDGTGRPLCNRLIFIDKG